MKIRKKYLVLAAGTLVAVLLGEGLLRVAGHYPLGNKFELADSLVLTPDPGLMPGTVAPVSYRRADGLRGKIAGPPQTCRILALGGSSTECFFLDDSLTWPALLERKLNFDSKTDSFWVGNAGYSGAGAGDHLRDLPEYQLKIEGLDAVLVMVGINDLGRALAVVGEAGEGEEDAAVMIERWKKAKHFLWRNSSIYSLIKTMVFKQSLDQERSSPASGGHYLRYRTNRRSARSLLSRPPAHFDYSLAEYRNDLRALIHLTRKLNLRIVLLTQPTAWDSLAPEYMKELFWWGWTTAGPTVPGQDYYTLEVLRQGMDRFNQTLKEVCNDLQVELLDLTAIQEPDTTMFYDDCHFNIHGARKVSDFIAEYIQE